MRRAALRRTCLRSGRATCTVVRGGRRGIHLVDRRQRTARRRRPPRQRGVALQVTRVGREVLVAAELRGVHEQRHDHESVSARAASINDRCPAWKYPSSARDATVPSPEAKRGPHRMRHGVRRRVSNDLHGDGRSRNRASYCRARRTPVQPSAGIRRAPDRGRAAAPARTPAPPSAGAESSDRDRRPAHRRRAGCRRRACAAPSARRAPVPAVRSAALRGEQQPVRVEGRLDRDHRVEEVVLAGPADRLGLVHRRHRDHARRGRRRARRPRAGDTPAGRRGSSRSRGTRESRVSLRRQTETSHATSTTARHRRVQLAHGHRDRA